MLNEFETNTIREIKARVAAGQPVTDWEKQMVLDLLRREGVTLPQSAINNAQARGFDVKGIKTTDEEFPYYGA